GGWGEGKGGRARPANSIASSPGSMIFPRRMIGISIALFSDVDASGVMTKTSVSAHVVHEVAVRLRRSRAGDLVVATFELGEADDVGRDPRRLPSAGAGIVPVDRDPVAGDESAPVCLGEQVV